MTPFTPKEWHDVSLCVGWTLAMADSSPEGQHRSDVSQRAMAAMMRVWGEGFHAKIVEELRACGGEG